MLSVWKVQRFSVQITQASLELPRVIVCRRQYAFIQEKLWIGIQVSQRAPEEMKFQLRILTALGPRTWGAKGWPWPGQHPQPQELLRTRHWTTQQKEEAWLPGCCMPYLLPHALTPGGYFHPEPQHLGPISLTFQNVWSIQINQVVL